MVMNKKLSALILICFIFSGFTSFSQFKYWIKLKDKTGTPYTLTNPSAFLTQKSISRRLAYSINYNVTDLPVNPSYVSQIDSVTDVTVLFSSKWLNGVVISVPSRSQAVTALATISTFSFVLDTSKVKKYHISINEPVNTNPETNFAQGREAKETSSTSYNYGGSFWQNQQLNVVCLHEQGYRGQGMTIGIMDAGFSNVDTYHGFDSLRNRGGIIGTRNFADGGTNVYMGSTHGTAVLSTIAGNIPGRMLGSAPLADIWLFRTEEAQETLSEEYNWIRAAEFADSVGIDVLTTSLGYTQFDDPNQNHTYASLNGRTAPMSIAANMAARKGMLVLNAAGNEGANSWKYISVPGDADSICTVGAVDTAGIIGGFSSVGPTSDKRIKPDFVATGVNTWITGGEIGNDGYPGSGTSFATPVLAGAMTCFWQAHKNFNNMKVIDTLKKTSTNYCAPNNSIGWGIPKMCPATKTLVKSSALLDGNTNHAGIKIKFAAVSSGAVTDSTYTLADGSYSALLNNGMYRVIFSKRNYNTKNFNSGAATLIDICPGLSSVTLTAIPVPAFDFTAYTNEANTTMTILLTDAGYEYVKVELIDLAGKTLFSTTTEPTLTKISFDISGLASEIYLLKVKTSLGTKTIKVLKRK
ncbi:hypothetical protein CNR22_21905 [Sphingobacteriaceae bacterium]|nr:hypothetical protein CNR22_21905 [Sphingobacteriaceae bacterium]